MKSIYSNDTEYRAGMFNKNEGFEHVKNIHPNADGAIKTAAIELEEIIIFPKMISPIFITNNRDLSAIINAQENSQTLVGVIKKTDKETGEIPEITFKLEKCTPKSKQEIQEEKAKVEFGF